MIYLLSLHLYVSLEADWFFFLTSLSRHLNVLMESYMGIIHFLFFKKPYVSSFSTVFIVLNGAIVL